MQSQIENKIAVLEALFLCAQSLRCSKRQPQLASEAAEREIQFKRELEELQAQLAHAHAPAQEEKVAA